MSFLGNYKTFFTSRDHRDLVEDLDPTILKSGFGAYFTTAVSESFNKLDTYYPNLEATWSPWFKDHFITHQFLFYPTTDFRYTRFFPSTSFYNNIVSTHQSRDFANWGLIRCESNGTVKVRIAAKDYISLSIFSFDSNFSGRRTYITNGNTNPQDYSSPHNDVQNSYYGNSIEFEYYGFKNEWLWLSFTVRNDGSDSSFQFNPWAIAYEFKSPFYEVPLKQETSLSITPNFTVNDYDVKEAQRNNISATLNISSNIKYLNEIIVYRVIATTNGTILRQDAIQTIRDWGTIVSSRIFNGRDTRCSQQNGQDYGLVTPGNPNYSVAINTKVPEYVYDAENNTILYFKITFSSESESKTYEYKENFIPVYELPRIYNFDYKKKSNGDYEFFWDVVNGTVKSLVGTSLTNPNNQTIFFDNYSLNNNQTFTVPSQDIISGKYKLIVSNQYGTKSTISALDIQKNYNPIDIIVSNQQDLVDSLDINTAPIYDTSTPNEEKVIVTLPGKTTITVPENCITATVTMWGAGGKDGNIPPGYLPQNWYAFGGAGGFAQADIIVCPGDTIDVYVGKSGEGTSENKATGLFTSNRGGGWSGIVYGQQHLIVGGGGAGGDYFYDPISNKYYGGGNGGDGSGAASVGSRGTIAYAPYSSISIYNPTVSNTSSSISATDRNYFLSGLGGASYFNLMVGPNTSTYPSGSINKNSTIPLEYYTTIIDPLESNNLTVAIDQENIGQYYINALTKNFTSSTYYFTGSNIPNLEFFSDFYYEYDINEYYFDDIDDYRFPSWKRIIGISNNSYQTIGRLYRRVENGIEILDMNNGGCSVSETVNWKLSSNDTFSDFIIDPNLGGGGGAGWMGGNAALFGGGGGGSGNLYNFAMYREYLTAETSLSTDFFTRNPDRIFNQISGLDIWLPDVGSNSYVSNYNREASIGTYKVNSSLSLDNSIATIAKYTSVDTNEKLSYDPLRIPTETNELWGNALGKNSPVYIPGTGGRNENGAVVIRFKTINTEQEKFIFTEDAQIVIPPKRRFFMLTAGAAGGSGSPDPATKNYAGYHQIKHSSVQPTSYVVSPGYSSISTTSDVLFNKNLHDINASPLGLGGLGGWGTAVWTKFENPSQVSRTLNIHVGKCGQDGKDSLNELQNGIALGGQSSISAGGKGGRVLNLTNEIVGGVGGGGGGASAVWEDVASTYNGGVKSFSTLALGSYVREFNPLINYTNTSAPEIIKYREIPALGGSGTEATFKLQLTGVESLRYSFGYSDPNFENIIKDTGYEYDDYKIDLLIDYESTNDLIAVSLPKYNEVRIYNNNINASSLILTIKPPNEYLESIEYFGRSISLSYSHATTSSYASNAKSYFIAISALSNQNTPKIFIYQFAIVGRTEIRNLLLSSGSFTYRSIYFAPTYKLHSIVSPPQIQWDQNQNGFFGYSIKFASMLTRNAYQRILYVGCPGYQNNKGIVYAYKINGEITSPILEDYYSEKYNVQNGYIPYANPQIRDLYPSRYSVSFETNSSAFDPSASWSSCTNCTFCSLFTDQELKDNNDALTNYIGNIEGGSENSYFGYSISSTFTPNDGNLWGNGRYVFISAPGQSINSIDNVGRVYVYDLQPPSDSWLGNIINIKLNDNLDYQNNAFSYSTLWNSTTKTIPIVVKWSQNTLTHFKIFENPNPSQKDYFGSSIVSYKYSNIFITAAGEDLDSSDNLGKTYRYADVTSTSANLTLNGAGKYTPIKVYSVSSLSLLNGGKNYSINDELYLDLSAYGFKEFTNISIAPLTNQTFSKPDVYSRIKITSIITNATPNPLCVAAGGGGGGGGAYDVPSFTDGYHYGLGVSTYYPYIQKNTISGNGIDSTISNAYYIGGDLNGLPENKSLYSISGHFYYQQGTISQGAGGYHSSGGGGGGGGIIPGGSKLINPIITTNTTDTLNTKAIPFTDRSISDIFKFSNSTVYTTNKYYSTRADRFKKEVPRLESYYRQIFKVTGALPSPSINGWIFDRDIATLNVPGTAGSPGFSSVSPLIYGNELKIGFFNDRSEDYVKLFLGSSTSVTTSSNYQYYKVPKNGFVYIELIPQFNIFHRNSGNWSITTAIYVYYNGWKKVRDAFIYKNNRWNKLN